MTTGAAFTLLALIQLWRLAVEGMQILADPYFWISTHLAVGLGLWASRLLWVSRKRWRPRGNTVDPSAMPARVTALVAEAA